MGPAEYESELLLPILSSKHLARNVNGLEILQHAPSVQLQNSGDHETSPLNFVLSEDPSAPAVHHTHLL